MPEEKKTSWYRTWFDSPYYDLLYKERDQQEADNFIKNLVQFLAPSPQARMLDIACGKGRHAISLNKMGFNVTGFDLSEKNIEAAKIYETSSCQFNIHDMRRPFMVNYYDVIFNLFTSFGYFEKDRDNEAVIRNIYNALKEGGTFVLDFVNMEKTILHLLAYEERQVNNIKFQVSKSINRSHFLVKRILVLDGKTEYNFEEKIKIFTLETLTTLLKGCGFDILKIFGDYSLHNFDPTSSDRMIIISKKK
jgi:2-polyprenyl-3-methyl-5-hydroxy-6-metoxy-1,4-benzoquinol methylase